MDEREAMIRGALATAFVLVGLLAGAANAKIVVVDKAMAKGDFAVAVAGGNVKNPRRLWVKVKASPDQGVYVAWTVVCSKNSGAGSKSGDFSGQADLKRRVKMPYKKPDSCSFSASAQLDDGGKLTVILLARKP